MNKELISGPNVVELAVGQNASPREDYLLGNLLPLELAIRRGGVKDSSGTLLVQRGLLPSEIAAIRDKKELQNLKKLGILYLAVASSFAGCAADSQEIPPEELNAPPAVSERAPIGPETGGVTVGEAKTPILPEATPTRQFPTRTPASVPTETPEPTATSEIAQTPENYVEIEALGLRFPKIELADGNIGGEVAERSNERELLNASLTLPFASIHKLTEVDIAKLPEEFKDVFKEGDIVGGYFGEEGYLVVQGVWDSVVPQGKQYLRDALEKPYAYGEWLTPGADEKDRRAYKILFVTTDPGKGLNLREETDKGSKVVAIVPSGRPLAVIPGQEESEEWVNVLNPHPIRKDGSFYPAGWAYKELTGRLEAWRKMGEDLVLAASYFGMDQHEMKELLMQRDEYGEMRGIGGLEEDDMAVFLRNKREEPAMALITAEAVITRHFQEKGGYTVEIPYEGLTSHTIKGMKLAWDFILNHDPKLADQITGNGEDDWKVRFITARDFEAVDPNDHRGSTNEDVGSGYNVIGVIVANNHQLPRGLQEESFPHYLRIFIGEARQAYGSRHWRQVGVGKNAHWELPREDPRWFAGNIEWDSTIFIERFVGKLTGISDRMRSALQEAVEVTYEWLEQDNVPPYWLRNQ